MLDDPGHVVALDEEVVTAAAGVGDDTVDAHSLVVDELAHGGSSLGMGVFACVHPAGAGSVEGDHVVHPHAVAEAVVVADQEQSPPPL